MSVNFEATQDGIDLVIAGRGDTELHRSSHRNKKFASRTLVRLRGVLREKKMSARISEKIRTGEGGELDEIVDEHQTVYALLEVMEVLNGYPQTLVLGTAFEQMNDLLQEVTGSRVGDG